LPTPHSNHFIHPFLNLTDRGLHLLDEVMLSTSEITQEPAKKCLRPRGYRQMITGSKRGGKASLREPRSVRKAIPYLFTGRSDAQGLVGGHDAAADGFVTKRDWQLWQTQTIGPKDLRTW